MQLTLFALTFATLAIAGPINPYEVRTAIKSTPSMSYGQDIDLLTTPTAVVVKREEAIEPPQADAKGCGQCGCCTFFGCYLRKDCRFGIVDAEVGGWELGWMEV
ncbi:hypothetical protein D6D08_05836 [Aureobasidium pullulans]|nr:hypothetical protein D6D08_05836 [Aureobasidium pullulans]